MATNWQAATKKLNGAVYENGLLDTFEDRPNAVVACESDAGEALAWVPHGAVALGGAKAYFEPTQAFYFVKPIQT